MAPSRDRSLALRRASRWLFAAEPERSWTECVARRVREGNARCQARSRPAKLCRFARPLWPSRLRRRPCGTRRRPSSSSGMRWLHPTSPSCSSTQPTSWPISLRVHGCGFGALCASTWYSRHPRYRRQVSPDGLCGRSGSCRGLGLADEVSHAHWTGVRHLRHDPSIYRGAAGSGSRHVDAAAESRIATLSVHPPHTVQRVGYGPLAAPRWVPRLERCSRQRPRRGEGDSMSTGEIAESREIWLERWRLVDDERASRQLVKASGVSLLDLGVWVLRDGLLKRLDRVAPEALGGPPRKGKATNVWRVRCARRASRVRRARANALLVRKTHRRSHLRRESRARGSCGRTLVIARRCLRCTRIAIHGNRLGVLAASRAAADGVMRVAVGKAVFGHANPGHPTAKVGIVGAYLRWRAGHSAVAGGAAPPAAAAAGGNFAATRYPSASTLAGIGPLGCSAASEAEADDPRPIGAANYSLNFTPKSLVRLVPSRLSPQRA